MKQFNLEEWLKDKSRKLVTRSGRPARIICYDRFSPDTGRIIVGLIENSVREKIVTFDENGHYSCYREGYYDLMFSEEEVEKSVVTAEKIKEICIRKGITFIPHHNCACCMQEVGWYLLGRWPPYEVAFSPSCRCSYYDSAQEESWEDIAEWVTDENGLLKERYKHILS